METCPNCGADFPEKARACPECGADEKTGWSDEAAQSALGLPDEEFDYGRFVENEFGRKKKIVPAGLSWFWWCVAIIVLLGCILTLIFKR